MKKQVGSILKRALPTVLVVAALIALIVIAFSTTRTADRLVLSRTVADSDAVAAQAEKIDERAMAALDKACEYLKKHDFTAKTNVVIKARAFGIPHTQKVTGSRSVKDGVYFERAETKSMFVKAAVKKASSGDGYDVWRGEYKRKKFVYGKPKHMTADKFTAAFGKPVTGLVRYELDGTIVEATTVSEGVYKFKLDAKAAAAFSKNEIKTLTNSKKHPNYKSVSFTLYCDGDRPIKVCSYEKFRADICGGTDCTATYTDTFTFEE